MTMTTPNSTAPGEGGNSTSVSVSGEAAAYVRLSILIDELDEDITNSSKLATSINDEFLVYLIDIAVLRVRKIATGIEILVPSRFVTNVVELCG